MVKKPRKAAPPAPSLGVAMNADLDAAVAAITAHVTEGVKRAVGAIGHELQSAAMVFERVEGKLDSLDMRVTGRSHERTAVSRSEFELLVDRLERLSRRVEDIARDLGIPRERG